MNIDITQLAKDLLINIANILIMFIIVKALVYKPVKKFLDERKERVEKASSEAAAKINEAESLKSEYEALLKDADAIKQKSVIDGENEAKAYAKEIIEKANEKANTIIAEAEKNGKAEKDKLLADAEGDIVALSLDITRKILSREIGDDDNRKIAEAFLKDIR